VALGDSVSGYDGLANVARVREARRAGRLVAAPLPPEMLGGMELRDASDASVASLLARLGFSAGAVLDLTTFLVQAAIAFFGVRVGTDLAAYVRRPQPPRLVVGRARRGSGRAPSRRSWAWKDRLRAPDAGHGLPIRSWPSPPFSRGSERGTGGFGPLSFSWWLTAAFVNRTLVHRAI
jgi:hypothetical protein